jgi:hypothetical protein
MTGPPRSSSNSLFLSIDETGHESGGACYVAAVVAVQAFRDRVEAALEAIESDTEKHRKGWARADPRKLDQYMTYALDLDCLSERIYYVVAENVDPSEYAQVSRTAIKLTAEEFSETQRLIVIPDGYNRIARERLRRAIKGLSRRVEVWSGGFDGHASLRLADTVANQVFVHRCNQQHQKYRADIGVERFIELGRKNEPPARNLLAHVGG